jgi:hypothetical protein
VPAGQLVASAPVPGTANQPATGWTVTGSTTNVGTIATVYVICAP